MLTKMALMTGEVANAVSLDDFDISAFFDVCVDGITKITELLPKFPFNIFLIGGPILGLIIGVFVKVKRSATRR